MSTVISRVRAIFQKLSGRAMFTYIDLKVLMS